MTLTGLWFPGRGPAHDEADHRPKDFRAAVDQLEDPISIIVPCHRVIGSNGSLTGFGGGLRRKRALLDLEAGIAHGHAPVAELRQIAML